MGKPSEDDFVNEGLSEEEATAAAAMASEPVEKEPVEQEQPEQVEPPKKVEKVEDEPKTVDIRALQEARAENRDIRDKYSRLEERTNMILERLNKQPEQPKSEEDTPPNPDEDIFAYTKWQAKQLETLQSQLAERSQQETQTREQQQQEQAIWGHWQQSATAFTREQPDFTDAAQHLSTLRDQQLQALSVVDPRYDNPAFRNMQINEELKGIIAASHQKGLNPAQAVYQIAQSYGYKKAEAQPGPEDIKNIADRQERHRSLSDAAGGEPPKALDAKTLAGMSDAAFKKLMDDPKRAAEVDKIMGLA